MNMSMTETPVLDGIAGTTLLPALHSISMESQANSEVDDVDPILSTLSDDPSLSDLLDHKEHT